MLLAQVLGTVVSTRKDRGLLGLKLLLTREVDAGFKPTGNYVVAADAVGAGADEIVLLAQGRLVNLGAAEGHPATVMDMSFANQALGLEWLRAHVAELEPVVYGIPDEIDREVARLKLESMGIRIEPMTPEPSPLKSSVITVIEVSTRRSSVKRDRPVRRDRATSPTQRYERAPRGARSNEQSAVSRRAKPAENPSRPALAKRVRATC